jgi:hypothetical protein
MPKLAEAGSPDHQPASASFGMRAAGLSLRRALGGQTACKNGASPYIHLRADCRRSSTMLFYSGFVRKASLHALE